MSFKFFKSSVKDVSNNLFVHWVNNLNLITAIIVAMFVVVDIKTVRNFCYNPSVSFVLFKAFCRSNKRPYASRPMR